MDKQPTSFRSSYLILFCLRVGINQIDDLPTGKLFKRMGTADEG
jgi:hypothetical protein